MMYLKIVEALWKFLEGSNPIPNHNKFEEIEKFDKLGHIARIYNKIKNKYRTRKTFDTISGHVKDETNKYKLYRSREKNILKKNQNK